MQQVAAWLRWAVLQFNAKFRTVVCMIAQDPRLWSVLPFILAMAREGSFMAAADALGVDRTTVARNIAAAERLVGGRLIERDGGRPALTTLGRRLATGAEAAEEQLTDAVAPDSHTQAGLRGMVRVAIAPNLAEVVAPALIALLNAHPELRLTISARYAIEDVAARDADVAMRIMRTDPDTALHAHLAGDIRGALFTGPTSADTPPIFVGRAAESRPPDYAATWTKDAQSRLIVDGIAAHAAFVAAGGVGRMPHFMANRLHDVEAVSETLPFEGWRIWVVSTPLQMAIARVRTVFDALAACAEGLCQEDG